MISLAELLVEGTRFIESMENCYKCSEILYSKSV